MVSTGQNLNSPMNTDPMNLSPNTASALPTPPSSETSGVEPHSSDQTQEIQALLSRAEERGVPRELAMRLVNLVLQEM